MYPTICLGLNFFPPTELYLRFVMVVRKHKNCFQAQNWPTGLWMDSSVSVRRNPESSYNIPDKFWLQNMIKTSTCQWGRFRDTTLNNSTERWPSSEITIFWISRKFDSFYRPTFFIAPFNNPPLFLHSEPDKSTPISPIIFLEDQFQ